jgi:hypothetical protein
MRMFEVHTKYKKKKIWWFLGGEGKFPIHCVMLYSTFISTFNALYMVSLSSISAVVFRFVAILYRNGALQFCLFGSWWWYSVRPLLYVVRPFSVPHIGSSSTATIIVCPYDSSPLLPYGPVVVTMLANLTPVHTVPAVLLERCLPSTCAAMPLLWPYIVSLKCLAPYTNIQEERKKKKKKEQFLQLK